MYYEIRHAWEPKTIGVRDGLSQVEIKRDSFTTEAEYAQLFDFFDSQKFHQRENKVPNFPINIIKAHLLKNAKITDFMTFRPVLTGCEFIISDKVYEVMKSLKMPECYFYPLRIYSKDEKIGQEFYVFYTPFYSTDLIDFPNSVLYKGNHITGKTYHQIKSREEYREYIPKLIEFEKMVVSDKNLSNFDYVSMQSGHTFISERFKNIIESEKLTGLNIRNNDILHFE